MIKFTDADDYSCIMPTALLLARGILTLDPVLLLCLLHSRSGRSFISAAAAQLLGAAALSKASHLKVHRVNSSSLSRMKARVELRGRHRDNWSSVMDIRVLQSLGSLKECFVNPIQHGLTDDDMANGLPRMTVKDRH